MGGVITAGNAAEMSLDTPEMEVLGVTRSCRMLRLIDPVLPKGGLWGDQRKMAYFEGFYGQHKFAELRLPLEIGRL